VLAGKKRGRPRSNPLPILTTAHLLGSAGQGSGSSAVGSDGASVTSGDGGE